MRPWQLCSGLGLAVLGLTLGCTATPPHETAMTTETGAAWLGVVVQPIPQDTAARLGLKADTGVLVHNVAKGSPADTAGLMCGDVLIRIGDQEIAGPVIAFAGKLRQYRPGEDVRVGFIRDGRRQEVGIRLASRSALRLVEYKYERQPAGPRVGASRLILTDRSVSWTDPQGNTHLKLRDEQGGPKIEVIRTRSGQFIVKRHSEQKDGSSAVVTKTYENAEALRQGDIDAYGVFRQAPGGAPDQKQFKEKEPELHKESQRLGAGGE